MHGTPSAGPVAGRTKGADVTAGDTVEANGIVDRLLPNRTDLALDDIANSSFVDDGTAVPVTAVDQLLMAFTRRLVADSTPGLVGVIQIPRCQHRTALLLAITSHLLCRQGSPRLRGPVVLIAADVDLAGQLRTLGVERRYRTGLASGNPLSACRLTRSGALAPVIGSAIRPVDQSLIYFNTRVGDPPLSCEPPLVILDATSVVAPSARQRALKWALDLAGATIVAVGDLGDDSLVATLSSTGVVPSVLALDTEITTELVAILGKGRTSGSTLSSSSILAGPAPDPVRHLVRGELNEVLDRAYGALVGRPKGPLPIELELARNMLANGTRLAAAVSDYKSACADNLRPGELPSIRRLERVPVLPPSWRSWQSARYGTLATAVAQLWRTLEEDNPKRSALWTLLDELSSTTSGPIAIRCHSEAAVRATRATLAAPESNQRQEEVAARLEGRLVITTFKRRFPAGSFDAQILTGSPPPWHFSLLLGIEARATHILCYEPEEALLVRAEDRWATSTNGWQRALARSLGARAPEPSRSPVIPSTRAALPHRPSLPEVPGFTLVDVLDIAAQTLDPADNGTGASSASMAGPSMRSCVPVRLEDGRTWFCLDENHGQTPVLVVSAGGHQTCSVSSLRRGQCIVVPAGEGVDSVHARLVTAARTNTDVQEIDSILSQFRSAARALLNQAHSRQEAVERLRLAGAQAPNQLPHWADGSTIAPREPSDVEAVFSAATRTCPDLRLLYAVANQLRGLGRIVGEFISAIQRGAGEEAITRLRDLVGPVADEVLDEFEVVAVEAVETARLVPAPAAGRVR